MNKKFLFGALAGGIVYFLLGFLFYGVLFKNIYPSSEEDHMLFVFLGCMTFGFMLSYLLNKMGVNDCKLGASRGAIFGFMLGLYSNFFMYSGMAINYTNLVLDVIIMTVMGAITGALIGFVFKKLNH